MSADTPSVSPFTAFDLPEPLLAALRDVGYESPSPIQAATIPPLMAGHDVIGQAQTGTGKTAAFALPALAKLDPAPGKPQVLVLAPTRELAIQVAEAFQTYAKHIPGFQILPIYGGQGYGPQLHALRRGVHVVVGTPGRVIDHLQRGTLDLSQLKLLVLDEADEMLRMGFIDDVETVLKSTPDTRQVALFSATMPAPIRNIAKTHLREPVEVAIKAQTTTAAGIRQRYWMVSGINKLDALTRIMEAEPFEAMIVFARTKLATEELADKLAARGFAAAAINGDVEQKTRERTIQRLKDGQIDILVATDVAARGLDVERISHVLNYDIPYDTESYVHRIGRTGRAGRSGEAILFVAPRERGMLRAIERATRQTIEAMSLPSVDAVNARRVAKFLEKIDAALGSEDLTVFRDLVERFETEKNVPMVEIAAALAKLVQGKTPLLLPQPAKPERTFEPLPDRRTRDDGKQERVHQPMRRESRTHATTHPEALTTANADPRQQREKRQARTHDRPAPEFPMQTYRIDVGHNHGVQPGNIVGAIANEAELDSKHIGRIDIRDDHTLVDLPEGMPPELLTYLKKVRVVGQPLRMRLASDDDRAPGRVKRRPAAKRPHVPRHD
ncbi:MAG: DEAD/DEAH box helicase [Thermomonas sp.]|uniref:DEAD/DEAH box helicase n=1 Tax=Thermomonas sp. TaxID=1971895 RepID=UPI0026355F1C|nr:DEAD/DEAH box helicase [Thermomonas sp.]MCC7097167.1 DEAD/DEAH box helicase [Thermomonas sp.]